MENLIKNSTRDAGIFIFIWSFVSGVFISSFVHINLYTALLLILIALAILIFEYVLYSLIPINLLFVLLSILALSLGFVRFEIKDRRQINPNLNSKINESIALEGIVISEPVRKENVTQLVLLPKGDKKKSLSIQIFTVMLLMVMKLT